MSFKKDIYVDFDGVIHKYDSKYTRIDDIRDEPVTGAIDWLNTMLADHRFRIHMFTTRAASQSGIEACTRWMEKHGVKNVKDLIWITNKPNYYMVIDDRAFAFEGKFPEPDYIDKFKAWNKR